MKKLILVAAGLSAIAGCGKGPKLQADSAASAVVIGGDPDKNVTGGTTPPGYLARMDRPDAQVSGVRYTRDGDAWDVTTGPAHILYAARDSATNNYSVSAKFEQLEAPAHPEAFGIFIGGIHLDMPNQAYVYFLVRGTGEMLVRLRDAASTVDTIPWTANPAIPKQAATGKATYNLAVTVKPDSVRFMVNDKQVASLSNANLQSAGIAGIRVNHNLHLKVTPVSIKAP